MQSIITQDYMAFGWCPYLKIFLLWSHLYEISIFWSNLEFYDQESKTCSQLVKACSFVNVAQEGEKVVRGHIKKTTRLKNLEALDEMSMNNGFLYEMINVTTSR